MNIKNMTILNFRLYVFKFLLMLSLLCSYELALGESISVNNNPDLDRCEAAADAVVGNPVLGWYYCCSKSLGYCVQCSPNQTCSKGPNTNNKPAVGRFTKGAISTGAGVIAQPPSRTPANPKAAIGNAVTPQQVITKKPLVTKPVIGKEPATEIKPTSPGLTRPNLPAVSKPTIGIKTAPVIKNINKTPVRLPTGNVKTIKPALVSPTPPGVPVPYPNSQKGNLQQAPTGQRSGGFVPPGKPDSGVIAGPGSGAAASVQLPTVPRESVIPTLGPNLKLLSFKWDDENCARGCPELTQKYGFDFSTCDIEFRVTNTGDVDSGNFEVRFIRTTLSGTDTPLDISAPGNYTLAPYETKTFKFDVELYKIGRLFTLTIDSRNQVAETNENDNSATFLPR